MEIARDALINKKQKKLKLKKIIILKKISFMEIPTGSKPERFFLRKGPFVGLRVEL